MDKTGTAWGLSDYKKFQSDDDRSKTELASEMTDRRDAITNKLKSIIQEKNATYARFGVTPGESTEQSLAKLKAGDEQVRQSVQQRLNPGATPTPAKPATAPPQTATAKPAKTATVAQITAYAKQKGITPDAAKKEFTGAGYAVQ